MSGCPGENIRVGVMAPPPPPALAKGGRGDKQRYRRSESTIAVCRRRPRRLFSRCRRRWSLRPRWTWSTGGQARSAPASTSSRTATTTSARRCRRRPRSTAWSRGTRRHSLVRRRPTPPSFCRRRRRPPA